MPSLLMLNQWTILIPNNDGTVKGMETLFCSLARDILESFFGTHTENFIFMYFVFWMKKQEQIFVRFRLNWGNML